MKKVIFSFFSGSGFLDLGFEMNGFETVFVNEYHSPFVDAYKYSRKKLGISEPFYGYDTNSIDDFFTDEVKLERLKANIKAEKRKGNIVTFIGGPPCPDFSVGGKNKGKEGENGRLTESYVDLICICKPDFFMFENVKGLWRTKRHREFYDLMKSRLEGVGYSLTDRLSNSIEFGAPQDRDRIILVGASNNSVTLTKHISEIIDWEKGIEFNREEVFGYVWPSTDLFVEGGDLATTNNEFESLTVQYWFDQNDVINHPNAKHHFQPRAGLAKFKIIDEGDVAKKSYKRLHRWRYSPTAAYGNNEVHLHPFLPRRISAAEALAIQSLPKEFELPPEMSLSNMFKTIGNGVPFKMSEGIAKIMSNIINNSKMLDQLA